MPNISFNSTIGSLFNENYDFLSNFNDTSATVDTEIQDDSSLNFVYTNDFKIFIAVIWMILVFFGVLGNGLVILIAIKYKKLNDITNCFIFNLAITDLLFLLFCVPFTTFVYIGGDWVFGNILCKLSHFFSRASVQATCLTLTVMTIHRCTLIIKNKTQSQGITKLKQRQKSVIINTVLIWIASFVISGPDLVYSMAIKEDSEPPITICTLAKELQWLKFTNLISVITAYTLPLLIIILSYTRLLSHLTSNHRRLGKFHENNGPKRPSTGDPKPLIGKQITTQSKAKSKTKKVTKMVAIVTLNFAFCWFPTHVFVLLRHFHPNLIHDPNSATFMYLYKIFANTLIYLTPVINPCLYAFFNENFRIPLVQLVENLLKKFECK